MFDRNRLAKAYRKVRRDLLVERNPSGHWIGELSTSALSTATAVSALAIVSRTVGNPDTMGRDHAPRRFSDLIRNGVRWLANAQNVDGGWGDTDKSHSNIATTMLVVAAFHLADQSTTHAAILKRAEQYIDKHGRIDGLRQRYGKDKTFAVPILTNCALANLIDWKEVSPLPFELACLPQGLYRFLGFPVVSYAIPALVGIGQARYFHRPPRNPVARLLRAASVRSTLNVLDRMQPETGGYLEAVPLTSFVCMSLASTGRVWHPVTKAAVDFIIDSVRPDGSWPIDTNLAMWNTTLSLNALAGAGEDIAGVVDERNSNPARLLDWILGCQYQDIHPFTGARPGGWGWSDLSGAVPDADDTPSALLTLAYWRDAESCAEHQRGRIRTAAIAGCRWLLSLQNRDGGWPTFCRGWGKLPFDRSGSDLTAHALRALKAWWGESSPPAYGRHDSKKAIQRGFSYLRDRQCSDGSWLPLWFGNHDHQDEENPVYGTAKVLKAFRDFDLLESAEARHGLRWLCEAQNEDGGWGNGTRGGSSSSVEETALAVEALLGNQLNVELQPAVAKGLEWLVNAVEKDLHGITSPIGFYFAKLWYHEKLYPLIFTASALGRAQQLLSASACEAEMSLPEIKKQAEPA
ncbi:MAG: squalene--hopene cyclase [Pirellulaceae bacterium]|nr:squalene--hopene cyclase [Pirellulaceae bacterium]